MRKFKNRTILFIGLSILSMLSYIEIANGQDKPQAFQHFPFPPALLELKPDLVVDEIYGRSCPDCVCGRTNLGNHPLVEYLVNIEVYVKNQGNAASGPCTLRIELYDVIRGDTVTVNKSVPRLERGHGRYIITERGEFLFRKSTGIKATIDSRNVVIESNEGNNTLTVRECILPLL